MSRRAFATALAGARDGASRGQREWKETPTEVGEFNGFPSSQFHVQFVTQAGGRGHTFIYAAVDGNTLIMLTGTAPDAAAELAEGARSRGPHFPEEIIAMGG